MPETAAKLVAPAEAPALLTVRNLKKYFPVRKGVFSRVAAYVKAVDGVSFEVKKGETLGLVGESGCGKTTAGRALLRLLKPTAGEVYFDNVDVLALPDRQMRAMRRRMQIIFQDPYSSLNPRMTVEGIVGEALGIHGIATGEKRRQIVRDLLATVGLQPEYLNRYPHEFSGGQRQRIGIARAIALNPDFIVCDEAVSALDVSIQAQILNLLQDLQRDLGLSYLFIAHNLSVVEHVSDRVAVMYLGKIVESSPAEQLYARPIHPYTEALLSAVPLPDPHRKLDRIILEGDVPSPLNPPPGCHFHPRCRLCEAICKQEEPPEVAVPGEPDHRFACHVKQRELGA